MISNIKAFVKRHETFLACSSTAIATYAVTRYVTTQKTLINDMAVSLVNLRDELDEATLENSMLFEFLDNKKLRDEYLEFVKQKVANTR